MRRGTSLADPDAFAKWVRVRPWLVITAAILLIAISAGVLWMMNARDRETLARALTRGNPHNGPQFLRVYGCGGCHTIPSLRGADGQVGPRLDNLRTRVFVAGRLPNNAENLVRFISAPQETVPGCGMPDTGIGANEARDVVAYLYVH